MACEAALSHRIHAHTPTRIVQVDGALGGKRGHPGAELALSWRWRVPTQTYTTSFVNTHTAQVDGALGGKHGHPGAELALAGAAAPSRITLLSPLRRQVGA